MTFPKEEESEYETDSECDYSEDSVNTSPYSSKPLPELSEAEISAARQLSEWLAQIGDPKTNVIHKLHDTESDDHDANHNITNDDTECDNEVLRVIGERNKQGRLDGECEVFYKNGDYFWGHFVDGTKHGNSDIKLIYVTLLINSGEASVVRANGDHLLGHYEGGRLRGVVREELEGGLVVREAGHSGGWRHGAFRQWRAGHLDCAGAWPEAVWTRTRSHA